MNVPKMKIVLAEKRPVHPFPSVADIVRSIPAGTNFFAKMDAIHGCFQLALDEES